MLMEGRNEGKKEQRKTALKERMESERPTK
jgi:hypothetical protein